MRLWTRVISAENGALVDMKEHLELLASNEDRLSKATNLETLHYQRGKVDGIKLVLSLLNNSK